MKKSKQTFLSFPADESLKKKIKTRSKKQNKKMAAYVRDLVLADLQKAKEDEAKN